MMVRIKKGKKKLRVAASAYKNFYQHAGWELVNNKQVKEIQRKATEDDNAEGAQDADLDDVTKPLSEMDRKELEELAEERGISLAGLTTVKQMREALKAAVR